MQGIRQALGRANLALAALMAAGADDKRMGDLSDQHRILVIGKSGNGKSALCNTLCGGQLFQIGRGLAATTRTMQQQDVHRFGHHMRVVDTPDVTNLNMTSRDMEAEVDKWRRATYPYPTAVLLTVRCDIRYTAEEHAIYRQIQRLWGDNSLAERLVVAFTFGDCQDNDLEEELKTVCPELKSVLADASHRYVLFNYKAHPDERDDQVQQLFNVAQSPSMGRSQTPKYLTPALAVLCVISGLCFAATVTANKSGPSIGFGLLCLVAGLGLVALRIKEKLH